MTSDEKEDSAGTAGMSPETFTQRLQGRATLVVTELGAFLAEEFPPRETILAPVIQQRSVTLLYAWRSNAKTHVALGTAYSVATGGEVLKRRAESVARLSTLTAQCQLLHCWIGGG